VIPADAVVPAILLGWAAGAAVIGWLFASAPDEPVPARMGPRHLAAPVRRRFPWRPL
jgi:hypothetical protein